MGGMHPTEQPGPSRALGLTQLHRRQEGQDQRACGEVEPRQRTPVLSQLLGGLLSAQRCQPVSAKCRKAGPMRTPQRVPRT